MSIDFPATPTNGQTHSAAGATWKYDGTKWISYSATAGDVTAVTAGNGLTGGGTSGDLTLAMSGSYTGSLAVAGGIDSTGANSILGFRDRASAYSWGWYATGGYARLWSSTYGDAMKVSQAGLFTLGGGADPYRALIVHKPATDDPVEVRVSQNNWARIRYHQENIRIWSCGQAQNSGFGIWDESAGAQRFFIDGNGYTTITQRANFGNGFDIYGGTFYNGYGDGWLYFNGSLRVVNFNSQNDVNANGSLYFGGCRLYNNSGYAYFDQTTHANGSYSRGDTWCAGNMSAGNMTATNEVHANNNVSMGGDLYMKNYYTITNNNASTGYTVINDNDGTPSIFISWYSPGVTYYRQTRHYFQGRTGAGDFFYHDSGNFVVPTGTGFKYGGGVWADLSDIRTKRNVRDYKSSLAELIRLRPVTYQRNGIDGVPDDGRTFIGLVGNEAREVMPELVGTRVINRKGPGHSKPENNIELLTLDGTGIIYALVNAVKELTARLEVLEVKLA
jgi:hypothetical protein